MRQRFPALLNACRRAQETAGVLPQQLPLFEVLRGTSAAEFARMWPALRIKSGRCYSWFTRRPLRRPRAPRAQAPGGSCDNGPAYHGPVGKTPGSPGYGYWAKWCAPQGFAREFFTGGPAEGTIVGGNRAIGLIDPFWGQPWTRATASTFDPSRPWLKLPDMPGVWSPPGPVPQQTQQPPASDKVTGLGLHPLLSGRLYQALCKAPPSKIDWCCHQPGNYAYVNFVQDETTLVRYLNAGWKCGPRATSRDAACLAGWTAAVSMLPPGTAASIPRRRFGGFLQPLPTAPPTGPTGRWLRCQQVNLFAQPFGEVIYEFESGGTRSPHDGLAGWTCREVSAPGQ